MSNSSKPRVSLVMIVKNEEQVLDRNLERWKGLVDEWVIVDTGSTDGTHEVIKKWCDGVVRQLPWVNFIVTKNEALAMANGDWILFADADEYLEDGGLDLLKEWVEKDDPDVEAIACLILEKNPDLSVAMSYYRNRIWRNHGQRFVGPGVHEVISEPGRIAFDSRIFVWHDRRHRTGESYRDRGEMYISILKDWLSEHPGDPRALFYMGRSLRDVGRHDEAIAYYMDYLESPSDYRDERWQAQEDIAECYVVAGDYEQAIQAAYKALAIDGRRAESYALIGSIYHTQQRWEDSEKFFRQAASMPIPKDVALFMDPSAYGQTALDYLAIALYKQGKYADSLTVSRALSELSGLDQRVLNNAHYADSAMRTRIFFCLGQTPEPVYGGMIEKVGVGGVETTYIELPKALAAMGMEVFVFCSTSREHVSDGVYFIPWQHLRSYRNVDPEVVVVSRWFDAFDAFPKAKRVVWLQDAHFSDDDRSDSVAGADHVIVSSEWHRTYTINRYGHGIDSGKVTVVPLGVRKSMFQHHPKNPFRVMYSSNPDRGLYDLSYMWGEISARVPGVHLIVAYGWEGLKTWSSDPSWIAAQENAEQRVREWAERMGNVVITGRLPKRELYKWMASSSLILYPCNFWETFCLTAAECQMSRTPMVTTRMGALPHVLDNKHNVLIPGHPAADRYKKQFIETTVNLLTENDQLTLKEMATGVYDYASTNILDWQNVGVLWRDLLWTTILERKR